MQTRLEELAPLVGVAEGLPISEGLVQRAKLLTSLLDPKSELARKAFSGQGEKKIDDHPIFVSALSNLVMTLLEAAVIMGFQDGQTLNEDPMLEPVRKLPRFEALLRRLANMTRGNGDRPGAKAPDITGTANALADALVAARFDKVHQRFDAAMKQAVTLEKLSADWNAFVKEYGPLSERGVVASGRRVWYDVTVRCKFKNGSADVQVMFDSSGTVTGLYFRPGMK
jgi:hypothetical protein